MARPNEHLGRPGSVCPFVPGALERKALYKSIVVVFAYLAADLAKDFLDAILERLGASSYVGEGVVLGEFYKDNEGTAVYSPTFRPFTSPVPFLLMRLAVVGDWKFFLDDDDGFDRWVGRFGEAGARAFREELRRLPWRERHE